MFTETTGEGGGGLGELCPQQGRRMGADDCEHHEKSGQKVSDQGLRAGIERAKGKS